MNQDDNNNHSSQQQEGTSNNNNNNNTDEDPSNSENTLNSSSNDSLILLPTSEEENQLILSMISSITRAIDFRYRVLNFTNLQISDKILNIVEISMQDYIKIDKHLNAIWELNVGQNQLSLVPNCLSIFSRVERLILNDNQIEQIREQESWKNLHNCRLISLANNLISSLPVKVNPFPVHSLSRLILSNNQLSSLPSYIGECVNLVELDVSGNQLITIPRELENCKRLMRLYLQNNPIFCLPFELQHLMKLRTFRMTPPTINERLYRNMYSKYETTLLELAKRFIVNSDHALCSGQCCKMNLPPQTTNQTNTVEDLMEEDLDTSIQVQQPHSNTVVSFAPTLSFDQHKTSSRGMNFELLKSHYKNTIPKHIHEDLIDHTRTRPCSHCNTLMSPKSGIHFIALLKLPKISSNQIENIPHFCRACCVECFDMIPNKLV